MPLVLALLEDFYLYFDSNVSTIDIVIPTTPPANWLFSNLSSFIEVLPPKNLELLVAPTGTDEVNLDTPWLEQPRLLTHMVFDAVTKPKDHVYDIVYNVTIKIGRTAK